MSLRPGKLILILLIPALVYGGIKGFLYYKAKRTVDDIVIAAADQAAIRYSDITTDVRGAVTVSGISVQPIGYQDTVGIDAVRIASDDPLFLIRGAQWQPGQNAPPPDLSFTISGIHLPLSSDFVSAASDSVPATPDASPCAQGLQVDPQLLSKIGFAELEMEVDGRYHLNEAARTLEFELNIDLRDIESIRLAAKMTEVDVDAMSRGAAPQVNLGGFSVAMRVAPEFGRQALKACAMGSDQDVQAWSEQLASKALEQFEQQGLVLGDGLSGAVRAFYRDWGELKLVAAPSQPVGLLSLMFLPPEQLAQALSLRFSLNGEAVSDTAFSWQRPQAQGLSALFQSEQAAANDAAQPQSRRIVVRREYESIAIADVGRYIDHQVQIKPRGQPVREGVLKRIANGEAEVEQGLYGGKYTVYVPLQDIESIQALIQREIAPVQ